jgi:hypothetical protein
MELTAKADSLLASCAAPLSVVHSFVFALVQEYHAGTPNFTRVMQQAMQSDCCISELHTNVQIWVYDGRRLWIGEAA